MTLSTALQSIYDRTSEKKPEDDYVDPSGTLTDPDPTTQDPGQDDFEMVEPEVSDNGSNDNPTSTLVMSLIQWMADNSDIIQQCIDHAESEESEELDQDEFNELEEIGGKIKDPTNADPDNEFGDEFQGNEFGDEFQGNEINSNADELNGDELEDPDRQGDIRFVPNARLVYKRQTVDGTFEELWFFNSDKDASRSDEDIKKDILSGTDIDPTKLSSEDGTQQYTIWTIGNGRMIQIVGLSN